MTVSAAGRRRPRPTVEQAAGGVSDVVGAALMVLAMVRRDPLTALAALAALSAMQLVIAALIRRGAPLRATLADSVAMSAGVLAGLLGGHAAAHPGMTAMPSSPLGSLATIFVVAAWAAVRVALWRDHERHMFSLALMTPLMVWMLFA